MKTSSFRDQVSAAVVDDFNVRRIQSEIEQLNLQDACFMKAISEIDKVRDFIGDPSKILGSSATKHGEIAEQIEVAFRRAKDALNGDSYSATFEGIGRIAPEDYLINGVAVQSKFVNGLNTNLKHVIDHMDKYSYFGRDGSYYHIPKDHFDAINKIYNNNYTDQYSQKTINAIKNKISEIESKSGQSFTNVVKPGQSSYAEVQKGTIVETLDNYESTLVDDNENFKVEIEREYQAGVSEGIKAAGVAAAVGGGLSFGTSLYIKYKKENKNVFKGDLTKEDWKEVGVQTGKGAAAAGFTGGAIYTLTNCANLSAPLAGAFVTAAKGVSSLVSDYNQGEISFEEFQVNAIYLCADSAGVYLATIAGQTFIPIPVVGAVVGSMAGKLATTVLLSEDKKLAIEMEKSMQSFLGEIDEKYQSVVNSINTEFNKIGELREVAFDLQSNIDIVTSSIDLAKYYGVSDEKIIKNEDDLRRFLFN